MEAIYVGFVPNLRAWAFWIPEDKNLKIRTTNQARFDEHEFPFRKRKMVEQHLSDNSTDILFQQASEVIWVPYNKLHVSNYSKVHHDKMSDVDHAVVLKVESQKNTYTRAILSKFLTDSNSYLGFVIRKIILSMHTLRELLTER